VIANLLELLIKAKNLFRIIVIRNRHYDTISQANSRGLVFELSQRRSKVVFSIMEYELAIRAGRLTIMCGYSQWEHTRRPEGNR